MRLRLLLLSYINQKLTAATIWQSRYFLFKRCNHQSGIMLFGKKKEINEPQVPIIAIVTRSTC
jgi:hypothetical protein